MNNVILSEQIKKLRMSKKMTLSVMAERTGVTISAYENGTRTPSLDVLIKIAKLFNVTIDNLLGYSSKDFIDVTNLTIDQRNKVEEMVTLYKKFNALSIAAFRLGKVLKIRNYLTYLLTAWNLLKKN